METAPRVDFQGMEPSSAFRDDIMRRIKRLEDRFGRLTACRVDVRAPSGRHHTGGPYEIHIYLSLPDGREVAVKRAPPQDERFQRFEFALHDAFQRAERQLQEEVERMRGEVKRRAEPTTEVIRRLMREDGYGFLEGEDGREIYFHRNSIVEHGFDNLQTGARVSFSEEEGEEGPQATHVKPLGEEAPQ